MTKLKKSLIILVALSFITAVYLIDQYVYSWSGLIAGKIGACESKLIKAATPGGDGFKKLNYQIDLNETAAGVKANRNYSVTQNENSLHVSRNFGDLKYTIVFENRRQEGAEAVYYRYSVDCPACEFPARGEKCTAPDFELYKKIYRMTEDLIAGDKAKRELLSGLVVYHQNSEMNVFE